MAQREKEEELIWRGQQYDRAIQLYRKKNAAPGAPSVDKLVEGRFLRKKYKDPITNGDFETRRRQPGRQRAGRAAARSAGSDNWWAACAARARRSPFAFSTAGRSTASGSSPTCPGSQAGQPTTPGGAQPPGGQAGQASPAPRPAGRPGMSPAGGGLGARAGTVSAPASPHRRRPGEVGRPQLASAVTTASCTCGRRRRSASSRSAGRAGWTRLVSSTT